MVDSCNQLPEAFLNILSSVSDAIVIYDGMRIVYCNEQGHLLLQKCQNELLKHLQLKHHESPVQRLQLKLDSLKHPLWIDCLPVNWQGTKVRVAIIKYQTSLTKPSGDSSFDINDVLIRNHFDMLFKSAGDGYWDWHIPTATVFFSSSWLQMLGYRQQDITPSFNTWINLIHPDDLGLFLMTWTDYMENQNCDFSIEYRVRCHDNRYLWVEAHAIKELNEDGEILHLSGFHRNIESRKQNEARLREHQENLEALVKTRTQELETANLKLLELANKDPLSGLQNRRSFDENLKQQLLLAKRSNYSLCLLLMDIDYFKSYNDTYGHQLGDECIQAVAETILSAILRPGDFAARIGGEEFVAILQDTNLQGATKVAQRIQNNITHKELPVNPQTGQKISLSIGIAINAQSSDTSILELADKAMYAAKKNGRNQICFFSDDLESISYLMNNSII